MNNELDEKEIEGKIYEINGIPVMLDSDLAKLYSVQTKRINEAVKNNPYKFPERFSWVLNIHDELNLRSKFSTSSLKSNYGGRRHNIRVFTEQGVAMLTTIIKSKVAVETSIAIMDAFVKMRHFIVNNKNIFISLNNMNNKLIEHDKKINILFDRFEPKEILLLEGQTYDAYSKILDIFKLAKEELIIIDNYADNKVLNMISKLKVNIMLITKDSKRLNELDIEKYNSQYNNLKVIRNNTFHDRYIIIDEKEIYHLGASINNAGNKTFSINKLEDKIVIDSLLNTIINIINNSTK
jgi:hypothetical protein